MGVNMEKMRNDIPNDIEIDGKDITLYVGF